MRRCLQPDGLHIALSIAREEWTSRCSPPDALHYHCRSYLRVAHSWQVSPGCSILNCFHFTLDSWQAIDLFSRISPGQSRSEVAGYIHLQPHSDFLPGQIHMKIIG